VVELAEKKRKIIFCLTLIAIIGALIFSIIKYRDALASILTPFIISVIIAYLVNPVVVMIENKGFKRLYTVITVYAVFISIIIGVSYFVFPAIYRESSKLIDVLPFYVYKAKNYIDKIYINLSKSLTPQMEEVIKNNITNFQRMAIQQIDRITKAFFSLFEGIINWIIATIISFYLLKDKDYFLNLVKYLIPGSKRQEVFKVAREIDRVLTRFIRGQLIVALVIGILATIGFFIIDLNFALLMGIITGAANIIPYFGPIIGGVPVVILGLLDSPDKALLAILVIFIVQQLESGIITPKIVGDSVGIHPVFIMLSLFVAGRFFGIIGMFFAVPVAAILKIIIVYIFNKIV